MLHKLVNEKDNIHVPEKTYKSAATKQRRYYCQPFAVALLKMETAPPKNIVIVHEPYESKLSKITKITLLLVIIILIVVTVPKRNDNSVAKIPHTAQDNMATSTQRQFDNITTVADNAAILLEPIEMNNDENNLGLWQDNDSRADGQYGDDEQYGDDGKNEDDRQNEGDEHSEESGQSEKRGAAFLIRQRRAVPLHKYPTNSKKTLLTTKTVAKKKPAISVPRFIFEHNYPTKKGINKNTVPPKAKKVTHKKPRTPIENRKKWRQHNPIRAGMKIANVQVQNNPASPKRKPRTVFTTSKLISAPNAIEPHQENEIKNGKHYRRLHNPPFLLKRNYPKVLNIKKIGDPTWQKKRK